MNLIKSVLWVLWPIAGTYFALSIGIPEIRTYWRDGSRFGLFSCLGCTIIFLGTWLVYALIIVGLLREGFYGLIYPVGCLGIAIAILGYWIEYSQAREENEGRASQIRKRDHF